MLSVLEQTTPQHCWTTKVITKLQIKLGNKKLFYLPVNHFVLKGGLQSTVWRVVSKNSLFHLASASSFTNTSDDTEYCSLSSEPKPLPLQQASPWTWCATSLCWSKTMEWTLSRLWQATGTVLPLHKENLFKHSPVHFQRLDWSLPQPQGTPARLGWLEASPEHPAWLLLWSPVPSWALLTPPEHSRATAAPLHIPNPARGEALQRGTANPNPPDTHMWFVAQHTIKPHLWISAVLRSFSADDK